MEELFNIGISNYTIIGMIDINPKIKTIKKEEVVEKENILKSINCDDTMILDIVSSNPEILSRDKNDLIKLIVFLDKLGFKRLDILFDSNPFIFNLDPFEIEDYIKDRINNGEEREDIIDDLDSNPYLFNEI